MQLISLKEYDIIKIKNIKCLLCMKLKKISSNGAIALALWGPLKQNGAKNWKLDPAIWQPCSSE